MKERKKTITERMTILETEMKGIKKAGYGIILLLAGHLGIPLVPMILGVFT